MPESLLLFCTALAGGAGAVVRFALDGAITQRFARRTRGQSYPLGILVVNLSGSALIGLLLGFFSTGGTAVTLLGVGLLGGYTTFSTASFDTVRLLQRGRMLAGLANGIGQLVAAVLAAALGYWVGALLGG